VLKGPRSRCLQIFLSFSKLENCDRLIQRSVALGVEPGSGLVADVSFMDNVA
jgi:hypothetical protein